MKMQQKEPKDTTAMKAFLLFSAQAASVQKVNKHQACSRCGKHNKADRSASFLGPPGAATGMKNTPT